MSEENNGIDVVGQEILAKVLGITGYTMAIFSAGQSRGTAAAKRKIYALMRSCVHPEVGQLSLIRIARLCGVDHTVVRHHLKKHGDEKPWNFNSLKVREDNGQISQGAD